MSACENVFPLERSKYELLHQIGRSESVEANWEVYVAKCTENQRLVAVKQIDLDVCPVTFEQIYNECKFWSTCCHTNMIDYYGSFVDGSLLWFLTEYMDGGSIKDVMQFGFARGFDETVIATLLKGVLQFLVYYHEAKQIHRNLRANNILLSLDGQVKVGGVSSSATMIQEGHRKRARYTMMSPSPYAAPEVLMEGLGHSEKVDIWSLGIIAYEMCVGKTPYDNMTGLEIVRAIVSDPAPEVPHDKKQYSSQMRDFVKQCLNKDPERRPSAATLLKHGLIKKAKGAQFLSETIMANLPPLYQRFELNDKGGEGRAQHEKHEKIAFDFECKDTPAEAPVSTTKIGRFTVSVSKPADEGHAKPEVEAPKPAPESPPKTELDTDVDHVETEVKDLSTQVTALEESHKQLQDILDEAQENIKLLMERKAQKK